MGEYHAEWAREFVRGGRVEKPEALALSGYTTVQNASYFALPLAPNLELLAVDRRSRLPIPVRVNSWATITGLA
jgi:hypothetical protein